MALEAGHIASKSMRILTLRVGLRVGARVGRGVRGGATAAAVAAAWEQSGS